MTEMAKIALKILKKLWIKLAYGLELKDLLAIKIQKKKRKNKKVKN